MEFKRYKTSPNLLSLLLDDAHDIKMMMRTLDMTSLDRLNHLLGCIDGVKGLRMRSDHPNNICNQIPKLPLHVDEDKVVVYFHVH